MAPSKNASFNPILQEEKIFYQLQIWKVIKSLSRVIHILNEYNFILSNPTSICIHYFRINKDPSLHLIFFFFCSIKFADVFAFVLCANQSTFVHYCDASISRYHYTTTVMLLYKAILVDKE